MELHRLIPHSLLKKDHDEARELTRQVLASKPDSYEAHWAHLLMGRIELQALGNLDAAEDHLKKAAELERAEAGAFAWLGRLYSLQAKWSEVIGSRPKTS